jgi:cell division protein FtsW (lipid II flippase)
LTFFSDGHVVKVFLPERQTDFVFSVFAEGQGFLGEIILLSMFLSLILWGLKIILGLFLFSLDS